jgi:hypothetical protein
MVNLQHLHCWSFLLIHAFSLPPLAYKRTPRHPLPHHNSSQAFSSSFHRVQINSIFLCLPVLSSSNDISSQPCSRWSSHRNAPNFSSRCSHMSPTTYRKIAASGIETQPGSHSSWQRPRVYTHSVHMTEILILFILYSHIISMHRPHRSVFSDVLIISAGAFVDFGHDATRNVIAIWTTTLQPCSDLTPRCPT